MPSGQQHCWYTWCTWYVVPGYMYYMTYIHVCLVQVQYRGKNKT